MYNRYIENGSLESVLRKHGKFPESVRFLRFVKLKPNFFGEAGSNLHVPSWGRLGVFAR